MRATVVLLVAALALATQATPAHAEQSDADSLVRVNARVSFRRWSTDAATRRMSSPVIGTVIARAGDALQIRVQWKDTVVTVDTRTLARLDVSIERHRHPMKGALIGLGVGALFGAVGGVLNCRRCQQLDYSLHWDQLVRSGFAGAASGAGEGAIVGGGIGYLINTERWAHIIPLRRTALRIHPGPGRMTLTVSHSF